MANSTDRTVRRAPRALRAAPPAPVVDGGTGVDLTASKASTEPLMPNERDEKVGMTGGVQSTRVQQGARDLKRGVLDTSRSVEADTAYKQLKK